MPPRPHDCVHPASAPYCQIDVRGTVDLAEAALATTLAERGLPPTELPAECFAGNTRSQWPAQSRPKKPALTDEEQAVYQAILNGDRSALDRATPAVLRRVILSGAATKRAVKDAARARLQRRG